MYKRTAMLIGEDNIKKLKDSKVIIFGIGGVGSFTAEALARAGVGHITLVDDDIIAESNINRQLIALHSTIGLPKVEVMKSRLLDINPSLVCSALQINLNSDTITDFKINKYDFIVDAIDTVSSKILLVVEAKRHSINIISALGAGNKLDPTQFKVSDIYKTSSCPLARVMRRELKRRNISSLTVVYSEEVPIKPNNESEFPQDSVETVNRNKRQVPGSISFVPSSMGLIIASQVVKVITG